MSIEAYFLDSYIRRYYLNRVEIPLLRALNIPPGLTILEVGCGKGISSRQVYKTIKPAVMFALDLKVVKRKRDVINFVAGDAQELPFMDSYFDLVIEFCCMHHVHDWRKAISEVQRVLRPGGMFVFEDFGSEALNKWQYRNLFNDHPTEGRFSEAEFLEAVGGVARVIERTWFRDAFFGYSTKEK